MRFKRAMAASMAAVMAVSSAVVCQVTASAAALENAPEGTEKVLASVDLANGKYDNDSGTTGPYQTEFNSYWENGDWVQTPDLGDKDILNKDNVYVKVTLSNLGNVKHGTEESPVYSPWSEVLNWGFANRSWAGTLHWYNNNKTDGKELPENFDVTFVPTEGSTADNAVCYAPISDFNFVSWGNVIAGNFQCANASTMKIESVEIVEMTPSSVAVSSLTIEGEADRTVTYGDSDVTLTATANADATDFDETKVRWTSSDTDVATVSADGKVTFVGAGSATIKAIYDGDDTISGSVKFTVAKKKVPVTVTAAAVTGATTDNAATEANKSVSVAADGISDKDYTVDVKVDGKKYTAAVKLTDEAAKKYELTGATTAEGTISYKVTNLKLSADKLSVNVTSTAGSQLTVTAVPDLAEVADGDIEWASSDDKIAKVSSNGLVTPVAVGNVKVTATLKSDKTISASCDVTVFDELNPAVKVELDKAELSGTAGEKADLKAAVTAKDTTKDCTDNIVWASSNEKVATVVNGTVTFVGEGTADITATAGEASATCKVTVKAATVAVDKVTLDKTSAELTVGDTATIKATVTPDNATDKTVTWTSSDESVATVKDGVVTAVKAGKATITAKAGDKTADCAVTVKAKEEEKPSDDKPTTGKETEIWTGNTDLGTDWSKSVTVPKSNVKIGDTIRIKVSTGSADYHQIKIMDSSWNVLSSLKSKADAQYGTITVDKDGYVEFVVNAADAKLISEGGLIISGYDLTVSAVSSRAMKDETYAPSTKVHTVVNNGASQIAVFAISEEDAEKYESYTIIITRGSDGKSVYEIVDDCYKYVSYNNGSEDVRVSGNGAYYIMLDITGIEDGFGGITVKIVPTVPKG